MAGVVHSGSAVSAAVAASSTSTASGAGQLLGRRGRVDLDVVDEQEAEQPDGLARARSSAPAPAGRSRPAPAAARRSAGRATRPASARYGTTRVDELLDRQRAQVGGVDRLGLLQVEAGRVGADPGDVEGLDQLGHGEDVAVLGDRPAQQRQVVDQALGQEAALAVEVEVGLRVALGQLLVALAGDERQVPEARGARRRRRCR